MGHDMRGIRLDVKARPSLDSCIHLPHRPPSSFLHAPAPPPSFPAWSTTSVFRIKRLQLKGFYGLLAAFVSRVGGVRLERGIQPPTKIFLPTHQRRVSFTNTHTSTHTHTHTQTQQRTHAHRSQTERYLTTSFSYSC